MACRARGAARRPGRVPRVPGIHRLPAPRRRRLPDRDRERRRRDRPDRRPAARRPGGQRALRAQCRQRPLGQPLRCAVRHRRHRSRRQRADIGWVRPLAGQARGRVDTRVPRRNGPARDRLARIRDRVHAARARRRRRRRVGRRPGRRHAHRTRGPAAVRRIPGARRGALLRAAETPPAARRAAHRPRARDRQAQPGRRQGHRDRGRDHHHRGLRGRGVGRRPPRTRRGCTATGSD